MADGDLQTTLVRAVLQSTLVTSRTGGVAAARIGLDHQPLRLGIGGVLQTPPIADGIHRQIGRVVRRRHTDMSLVALRIGDAIGRCATGIPAGVPAASEGKS